MTEDTSEKYVPKERWLRIIPPMIIIYVLSYMDRMNISMAMPGGMSESLGMSMALSGFAAGIFFIGYVFLQVPGGHIADHGSAKKFILFTIIAWGGISTLTAFVQNVWQLLAMRFLLGVAEGGLWPAILVILSNWFPARESGRANALFMSSMAIATFITSPLSGWLINLFTWRGMFVIEGLGSLAMIFFWLPLIYDRPQDAKWISKEEREYLVETITREREEVKNQFKSKVSYRDLWTDINLWKMNLIYFSFQAGRLGFMLWLPTIVKNLTKMGIASVGVLSAGPYLASILGMYFFSHFSDKDKTLNRQKFTVMTSVGFAIVFWLSTQFPDQVWLSYFLLIGTGFFAISMVPVFWSLLPLMYNPGIAGAVRGVVNAIGGLGAFSGTFFFGWITSKFGLIYGVYFLVFLLLFGAGLCLTLPRITTGVRQRPSEAAAAKV